MYAIPTWSRTVRLVPEDAALAAAIAPDGDLPSVYACSRFTAKLRAYSDLLDRCLDSVTASLRERVPELGRNVAVDGSDIRPTPTASGSAPRTARSASAISDPDASSGHRSAVSTRKGGGFYGYKIDALICTATDLPLAWDVRTARDNESIHALSLIDTARQRGFPVETCAMDKGYDLGPVYDGCEARDVRPIIRSAKTPAVERGDHKPPMCEHGGWTFAGADYKRAATKWRCPTGECKPASTWIKADRLHSLIPRETPRWTALYRRRAAVERQFGRLKSEWAARNDFFSYFQDHLRSAAKDVRGRGLPRRGMSFASRFTRPSSESVHGVTANPGRRVHVSACCRRLADDTGGRGRGRG
jgi:hypothetical protein